MAVKAFLVLTLGCLIEGGGGGGGVEGLNCRVNGKVFQNLISGRVLFNGWVKSRNFTKIKDKRRWKELHVRLYEIKTSEKTSQINF